MKLSLFPLDKDINDHAMLLSNVNVSPNDMVNNVNMAYGVPKQTNVDGSVYEDVPSEGVTVHTPALAAVTGNGQYSKLQRDSSLTTQSSAVTISSDSCDTVEAYYGKLGNDEQYTVSIYLTYYMLILLCSIIVML